MATREPISPMAFLKSTSIGGHFPREIFDNCFNYPNLNYASKKICSLNLIQSYENYL